MRRVLIIVLLVLVPIMTFEEGVFTPAKATRLSGLGIWSNSYQSPVILDTSLVANSFVVLRLNVTGGVSINGFDANVTWDPLILNYKNDTLKGGIFDNINFAPVAHDVGTGFVRWAGVINGGRVQGSGIVFTFTLKVVAAAAGSTTIHIARGILTTPIQFSPVPMDGFFSNVPGNEDLMLSSLTVNKETPTRGDTVYIAVGVRNIGTVPMAGVVVTVKGSNASLTSIPINSTTLLQPVPANSVQIVNVVWNTTNYSLGVYSLNATVTTTSPDSFPGDDSLALEQVTIVSHDLAVTSLTAPSTARVKSTVPISVVLKNLGTVQDTANVTIFANTIRAANQSFLLSAGSTNTETLGWNTTGVPPGNYTLKAVVQPVPGERILSNNVYSDGNITIQILKHDLAITGSLPSSATQGQNVAFTFTVENLGLSNENYTVRVLLDGQVILQSPQAQIASGASATVNFPTWNTRPYTVGVHTIYANVTSTSTDQDLSNNQQSTQFTLYANQPPLVSFTLTPSVPGPGVSATFNGTMSFDLDGDPLVSYSWSFGDNSANQTGAIANHVYANSGTYTVTLTITDILGASGTLHKQFRVNSLPVPKFTISTAAPEAGSQVTFDASSSTDSDGTITSYQWVFGDGSTSSGKIVTHTYASAGTYQVKLTVTDNDGGTKEYSLSVNVAPVPGSSQVAIYAIAGAVIVATGLAAWFLVFRRRGSRPASPSQSNA